MQLYNQLREQGRAEDELALIQRAYHLAVMLYSGYFQADGTPFVSHVVGVASIVARHGLPGEIVATACIHNVYSNGDFGDGRRRVVTSYRRRIVRDAVGAEVEGCVHRFHELRPTIRSGPAVLDRLDELDTRDRHLIVMELADILEKHVDSGFLYYGDSRWVSEFVADHRSVLIDLATRLGHPQLAADLEEAFETAALEAAPPEVLRWSPDQRYMALIMPRSCRLRPKALVRSVLSRARNKARVLRSASRV